LLANVISQRHLHCLIQRIAGKRAPTPDLRWMAYHRRNGIRRSQLAGERNLPAPSALPDTTHRWQARSYTGFAVDDVSAGHDVRRSRLAGERNRPAPSALPDTTHRGQARSYTGFTVDDVSAGHDVRRSRLAGERNRPAPFALPDTTHRGQARSYTGFAVDGISPTEWNP
jgi:hypothetical protein